MAVARFAIRARHRVRMPNHVLIVRPGRPQFGGHLIDHRADRVRPSAEVLAHQRIQLQLEGAELTVRRRGGLQHFAHQTGAYRDVAHAIDEDQPAGVVIALIAVQHQRLVEGQLHQTDAVKRQRVCRVLRQRIDLHLMADALHAGAGLLPAILMS